MLSGDQAKQPPRESSHKDKHCASKKAIQVRNGGKNLEHVTKNQGFFHSKSKEGKTPSLPRDGAQHMARQINRADQNRNQDFMNTPDPGVAGYDLLLFYTRVLYVKKCYQILGH